MADKTIGQLAKLTSIQPTDLFVAERGNAAKAVTGQVFEDFLLTLARAHGGIKTIAKDSTSGLTDTYKITLSDDTFYTFTVTNGARGPQGIQGVKGDTGNPAIMTSQVVAYQVGDSGTTAPTGNWTNNVPTTPQGKYLWTRTTLTFNSGDPVVFYSVSRAGIDGAGSVSSVDGVSPTPDGNVALGAVKQTDALSLEEITAATALAGKIPSAEALKAVNSSLGAKIVIELQTEAAVQIAQGGSYSRTARHTRDGYTCYYLHSALYASGNQFYFKVKQYSANSVVYDIINVNASATMNFGETTVWLCIKN